MWRLTIVYKMPRKNAVFISEYHKLEDLRFYMGSIIDNIGEDNILDINILPNVKQGSHYGYVQPT